MTEDLDIEAMLEAPYKKESNGDARNRSGSDSEKETKKHKSKRRSRSRSRERGRKKSGRSRSRSRERRRRSEPIFGRYTIPRPMGYWYQPSRSRERRNHRDKYRERDDRRSRDEGRRRRSRSKDREREREKRIKSRSASKSPVRKSRAAAAVAAVASGFPPSPERGPQREAEEDAISQEERDARTCFIMQLPRNVTARDIEEFFSRVGQVRDVRLISDRNSRRSKGIGYVEFTDPSAVPLAINLSGERLIGVPVMVQPTMAEKNRAAALAQNLSKPQGPTRLYVGSLHYNISETMLRAIFEPFGSVDNVQLIYDTETGRSKGYGFVTFRDSDSAKRALDQLNGFELAGRPMKVGNVTERSDGSMSFLDDEETEKGGIEMNSASRAALMQKLAATHAVGMNVPSAPLVPAMLQSPILSAAVPSSCFLLSNMFDPTKETDPGWDDDVKSDVLEELSKFGAMVHIHVDTVNPEGHIYCKCSTAEGATLAVQSLNGRWFAGRTIKAAIVPMPTYHAAFPQAAMATVPLNLR